MGLFTSINIAATGMSVERLRTDVIADNIANASTTRTPEGGKYQRKSVILESMGQGTIFRNPYVPSSIDGGPGTGVRVSRIVSDTSQGRMVYDPNNPDAIKSGPYTGYVEYPNINIVNEMVDLISASRTYEANSSVIQGSKDMFSSALEIAR